jgi:hypothetical protein
MVSYDENFKRSMQVAKVSYWPPNHKSIKLLFYEQFD